MLGKPKTLATQGVRRQFGDSPVLTEQVAKLQDVQETQKLEDLSLDVSKMGKYPQVNPGMPVWRYRTPVQVLSDIGGISSSPSEINLTPKAFSTGPEGTIYYDSDDNHIWVATE